MQAALNIENAILWIADEADFNDTTRTVEFAHACGYISAYKDLGMISDKEASDWYIKADKACDKAEERAKRERAAGGRR